MAKKTTYKIVDGIKIQDIQVYLRVPSNSPYYTNPKQIAGTLDQDAFIEPTWSQSWDYTNGKWIHTGWTGINLDNTIFDATMELDVGAIHRGYATIGCMDVVTHYYYYFALQDVLAAIKEYGVIDNKITGRFYFRRGGKVYLTPVIKD